MKESSTYQAIVGEGRVLGERDMLFVAAIERFGEPTEASRAAIEAVTDPVVLKELMKRLFRVHSWPELVANLPRPPRRRGNGRSRS